MTKTTTKNRKLGVLGFAAIAAVIAVGIFTVNFQMQLADAEAANKGGYATQILEIRVNAEDVIGISPVSYQTPLAEYYFKSSNYNEWGANFLLECATANHIQGKGKMDKLEGAQTGVKIFFVHESPDGSENVVNIDGTVTPLARDNEGDWISPTDDKSKWNVCSQTFEIKTQLNALIEECTQEDIDNAEEGDVCFEANVGLNFVCDEGSDDWDTTPCQQYVELFLETAGTHPAKVFLSNVPHGVNGIAVYAELEATSQNLDDDKTSVAIGKRMLDLYPVISDNNNFDK